LVVGRFDIDEEHRDSSGFPFDFLLRGGSCNEEEVVGLIDPGGPVLLTIDDILIVIGFGEGIDGGGVQSSVGLSECKRLNRNLTVSDSREEVVFHLFGPVIRVRDTGVYSTVDNLGCTESATITSDLFHHHHDPPVDMPTPPYSSGMWMPSQP